MSQKERKTLVLARAESTYGVDAILAALNNNPAPKATDAILCSNFDIQTNADTLQRENYSPSLSPDAASVGRVLGQMTFTTELRASGIFGVAPRIGRLFKACGMSETIIPESAGGTIANPVGFGNNASPAIIAAIAAVTKTSAPTSRYDRYRVTYTTGGTAGSAKFIVTGPGHFEGDNSVLDSLDHTAWHSSLMGLITVAGTLTEPTYAFSGDFAELDMVEVYVGGIRFYYQVPNGGDSNTAIASAIADLIDADPRMSADATGGVITVDLTDLEEDTEASGSSTIDLGLSGGQITVPQLTGAVTAGEGFEIQLRRPGVRYTPVSEDFSSVTIWAYLDGSLFRIRGARGTFSITGQAAQYPTISWTFTGLYTDPVDAAMPTGVVFEESQVFKVELSQLALTGLSSVIAAPSRFTFDMGNTVGPNENINLEEAFSHVDITGRQATAGTDPESTKPSIFSPWAKMRRGATSQVGVTVGFRGGRGNQVRLQADRASYTGAPFTNRNGTRAHDFGYNLARVSGAGDDELHITFH